MFSANTNNHYQLHLAHQKELEVAAQNYRLSSAILEENGTALRKRVGRTLISLGEKLSQQPEKEVQLAFSARR